MLQRAEYRRIKAELDFARPVGVTLAVIVIDLLLLALIVWLLEGGGTPRFVAAQLLLVVVFFHNFSLLHEAGHGNCSRSRAFNVIVGHYASILSFTPFYPWKHIHQKHHVWAGNPHKDPAVRNLVKWKEAPVPWILRAAWRTWIPLGAVSQHWVFWTYPLTLIKEDRSKLWQCVASVGLLPLGYAGLHLAAPNLVVIENVALALFLYLGAEELVNLPHHAGLCHFDRRLPLWEQSAAARSCNYPKGLSEALILNFNFHTEHHLFPSLPWFRLRKARALIAPALGDDYNQTGAVDWSVVNRGRTFRDVVLGTQE